jgi:hypothetical protein
MSDNTGPLADGDEQIAALERQIAIDRTSRETGIPPSLLGTGQTAEGIERIAADLLAWKAAATPEPPSRPTTSAVRASVVTSSDRIEMPRQVQTLDELRRMSPGDQMRAYRAGLLSHLGANPPGPRRIGISGSPMQG